MRVRIAVLVILLMLVTVSFSSAIAERSRPSIPAYPPPSKEFPIKVYVDEDFDELRNKRFTCPYHDQLVAIFYDVLRSFRKVVLRFIDEYPQYSKLALITFTNASSLNEADIVFRVVVSRYNYSYTEVTYGADGSIPPYIIHLECEELEESGNIGTWSVIFHELGHALGLDHPPSPWIKDEIPELMGNTGDGSFKVYPSTLDLYALYVNFFTKVDYGSTGEVNIILPPDIEYKMVIPYDVELKRLKEENSWLWEKLEDANDLISYFRDENEKLRAEYDSLVSRYQGLEAENRELMEKRRECEETVRDLVRYTDKLEEENRAIKTQYDKLLNASLALYEEYNKTKDKLTDLTNRYNELVERYNELLKAYNEAFESKRTCAVMLAVVAVILSSICFWEYWNYTRLERELERLRG